MTNELIKSSDIDFKESSLSLLQKIGWRHENLIRKIKIEEKNLIDKLINEDISNYWQKTTYKDSMNREQEVYLLSNKGSVYLLSRMRGPEFASINANIVTELERLHREIESHLSKTIDDTTEILKLISKDKNKVEKQFDEIVLSQKDILVGTMVKLLSWKMSQKQFRQLLKDKGFINRNNVAYQNYVDNGYFNLKYNKRSITTTITPKGQKWILENYLKWYEEIEKEKQIEDEKIKQRLDANSVPIIVTTRMRVD